MPQPIETAPKDGTPILTDCGIAANWGGRYEDYWIPCSPDGKTYENDYDDPIVYPTLWEPLPSWMVQTLSPLNKGQWQELFRIARVIHQSKPTREGRLALCRLPKLAYRALLCVEHREDIDYRMSGNPKHRLEQNKAAKEIIDEILAERDQGLGHYEN